MRVKANKRQSRQAQTLKQFVLISCCVLSLLASSVSACICPHHREKTLTEAPSCHSHAAENVAAVEQTNNADSPETINTSASEADACCCVQPAPKVVAKSENVKLEKQAAAESAATPLAVVFAVQIVSVENNLPKPLYLTDSFYNLSPGRAPPRI
ncbi:MAG TPA: hypothetical protein VF721_04080 [Pyrinomonadaceae bacterium]|jgi:hypothetical protein